MAENQNQLPPDPSKQHDPPSVAANHGEALRDYLNSILAVV